MTVGLLCSTCRLFEGASASSLSDTACVEQPGCVLAQSKLVRKGMGVEEGRKGVGSPHRASLCWRLARLPWARRGHILVIFPRAGTGAQRSPRAALCPAHRAWSSAYFFSVFIHRVPTPLQGCEGPQGLRL